MFYQILDKVKQLVVDQPHEPIQQIYKEEQARYLSSEDSEVETLKDFVSNMLEATSRDEVFAIITNCQYNTNCHWCDKPSAKSGLKRHQFYCPKNRRGGLHKH